MTEKPSCVRCRHFVEYRGMMGSCSHCKHPDLAGFDRVRGVVFISLEKTPWNAEALERHLMECDRKGCFERSERSKGFFDNLRIFKTAEA